MSDIALQKYDELMHCLKRLGKVAVAFSGGVDSTFLLAAAGKALGQEVIAITIDAPYIPRWEIKEAAQLAASLNVEQRVLLLPICDAVAENPKDRCYGCKRFIFSQAMEEVSDKGYQLIEGTNVDDLCDHRPGLRALDELGIRSPLKECDIRKEEVRSLSMQLGLPTWNKPASACLLTRIPHGRKVTTEELRKIERSEQYLTSLGFSGMRVRSHGDLARVEVRPGDRKRLCTGDVLDLIAARLKEYGFTYVCLDAEGYRTGSFNEPVE